MQADLNSESSAYHITDSETNSTIDRLLGACYKTKVNTCRDCYLPA